VKIPAKRQSGKYGTSTMLHAFGGYNSIPSSSGPVNAAEYSPPGQYMFRDRPDRTSRENCRKATQRSRAPSNESMRVLMESFLDVDRRRQANETPRVHTTKTPSHNSGAGKFTPSNPVLLELTNGKDRTRYNYDKILLSSHGFVERGSFWTAHHLHIFPCVLD